MTGRGETPGMAIDNCKMLIVFVAVGTVGCSTSRRDIAWVEDPVGVGGQRIRTRVSPGGGTPFTPRPPGSISPASNVAALTTPVAPSSPEFRSQPSTPAPVFTGPSPPPPPSSASVAVAPAPPPAVAAGPAIATGPRIETGPILGPAIPPTFSTRVVAPPGAYASLPGLASVGSFRAGAPVFPPPPIVQAPQARFPAPVTGSNFTQAPPVTQIIPRQPVAVGQNLATVPLVRAPSGPPRELVESPNIGSGFLSGGPLPAMRLQPNLNRAFQANSPPPLPSASTTPPVNPTYSRDILEVIPRRS